VLESLLWKSSKKKIEHHVIMFYYPLVNVDITHGKITMLLMGKATISMAILNGDVSLPEGKFTFFLSS
jgi:predicted phosphohydrolase